MGNFGKRLLVISLSIVAVVTLAIVGNSIQQSERLHKISNSSDEVYSDVTRGDLWDAIINSSITDTMNEKLNRVLLSDVISSLEDDDDLVTDKINYLKYSTTDEETIEDLTEDEIAECEKAYKNKMYALGYYTDADFIDYAKLLVSYDLYAEYRINNSLTVGSYDFSNLDEDANKDDWTEDYEDGDNYNDVYAIGVFFNSLAEQKDAIEYLTDEEGANLEGIVFDKTSAIYKYETVDEDGCPLLTDDFSALNASLFSGSFSYDSTYKYFTTTSGNDTYVLVYSNNAWYKILVETKVPVVLYIDNTKTTKYNYEFKITGDTYEYSKDNQSTLRTANATELTNLLNEYLKDDNKVDKSSYQIVGKKSADTYAKDDESVYYYYDVTTTQSTTTGEGDDAVTVIERVTKTYVLRYFEADNNADPFAYGTWKSVLVETKVSDTDTSNSAISYTFNLLTDKEKYEKNEVICSDYTDDESEDIDDVLKDMRKYSRIELNALDEDEFTKVSKDYSEAKEEALDTSNTFEYKSVGSDSFYLTIIKEIYNYYYDVNYYQPDLVSEDTMLFGDDSDQENIVKGLDDESYKDDLISKRFMFHTENEGTDDEETKLYKYTKSDTTLTAETEFNNDDFREATISEIYNLYYTLVYDGNDFKYSYEDYSSHSSTFATLLFDTYSDKEYTDIFKTGSSSPYYFVYRITDSAKEIDLDEYRQNLIDELLADDCFIDMCLLELRKDAKIQIYDQFISYSYSDLVEYDSDSNEFGIEEEKTVKKYYTKGLYSSKNIARINGVSFEMNSDGSIKSQTVSKKIKDRYKLTADDLYDYAMLRHGASYIASVKLNKTLKSLTEYTLIHGTDSNYLTSDNWRMTQYKNQVESLNYYYELSKNYPSIASYYGLGSYSSLKDYLQTYIGVRSWDRLVNSYMNDTLKYLYIYKKLINDDFTLTTLGEDTLLTEFLGNEYFDFNKTIEEQYSLDASHFLVYVDYNNDTYPDDYTEFKDNEDNDDVVDMMNKLYDIVLEYVRKKGTFSSTLITSESSSTAFNEFVTEYNDDDLTDGLYSDYKKAGIKVKYEALGSITNETVSNYDPLFGDKINTLNNVVEDLNDATAYYIDSEFTDSSFGKHIIIVTKTEDYEKVTFKENETDEEIDKIKTYVAKYMQEEFYSNLFGTTDDPEQYSKQVFPSLNKADLGCESEIEEKLTSLYSDELDMLTDSSASYMSTYLMLRSLDDSDNAYATQISCIKEAYEYTIFGK